MSRSPTAAPTGSSWIAPRAAGSSTPFATEHQISLTQSPSSLDYPTASHSCTSSSTPSSAFSFLQAASLPEALIDRAAELGYPALALLDRDGVYGAPRFHKAALAAGIRPIIGAELTIAGSGEVGWRQRGAARSPCPSSANRQEGYRNLCRLITRMKLRAPKGEGALDARGSRRP